MFLQSYSVVAKKIMNKDIVIVGKDSNIKYVFDYILNNIKKEVLVVEDRKLVGIITFENIHEIDQEELKTLRVEDLMTKNIYYLDGEETISDVRLMMKNKEIGRLPVLVKDEIVGIIREENIRDFFYKQIDDGEKAIRNIFDNINEAVCILDNKGRVIVWNRNAEILYNIDRENLLGKKLKDFFPNAIDLKVFENMERVKNAYHSPKEGYHVIINASPIIIDGNFYGVVSTEKGIKELSELQEELDLAYEKLNLLEEEMQIISDDPFEKIIGHSKSIMSKIDIAKQISPTNASVLLTGESGTGKEEFAKAIHRYSDLEGEFVPVNCSAIPSELFESEFFGYEPGAFTGASREGKIGFFEQAKNGTLFLDEIGDMPLSMQVKLLRVLQDKKIKKVGGEEFTPVDVRIISATNLDLGKMIEENKFREELYYRINVVEINLPPLRERKEDIGLFIDYFLKLICTENNKKILTIDSDVVNYLIECPWYGNIRELKNVIEHMAIMAKGDSIDRSLIPSFLQDERRSTSIDLDRDMDLNNLVEKLEKKLINKALEKSKGNRKEASKYLNIPRTTLHSKMNKYGID